MQRTSQTHTLGTHSAARVRRFFYVRDKAKLIGRRAVRFGGGNSFVGAFKPEFGTGLARCAARQCGGFLGLHGI